MCPTLASRQEPALFEEIASLLTVLGEVQELLHVKVKSFKYFT